MQEDFFQAQRGGPKFVQIPAGFDHGAGHIAPHDRSLLALDFKNGALLAVGLGDDAAHAGNLLELALHRRGIEAAVAARDFDQHGFAGARAVLQIAHRVGRHDLALVDDDDLLARLADFRKDVRAQNDRVIAREALDQVARLIDLLGIEARRRLVEDQDVRDCG